MPEATPNPWQRADKSWDWPKIRSAFLSGAWPNYELAAQETGIRPSYLRARAAQEDWSGQRAALERKAEEEARARILGRLTREFEKRLSGMLDTADVLRFAGLKTLGNEKVQLSGHEAIRALATATDIEREIFLRRGKPIGDGSDPGPEAQGSPTHPGNPGLLPAPASINEIPDAQLIRIIEHKPAPEPAPAPRRVEGRVVEGQDGDHARGGCGRGPAPKGRKG
jgi:hypothetical protein